MNRPLLMSATGSLLLAAVAIAAPPATNQLKSELKTESVPAWGMDVAEIPGILRMHCPVLQGNIGVLVADVSPDSPAGRAGLLGGDVVLEIDGLRVHDVADLPAAPSNATATRSRILVLRHGRVQSSRRVTTERMSSGQLALPDNPGDEVRRMMERMLQQSRNQPGIGLPPSWDQPESDGTESYGTMPRSGAYAASSASGNESMSVSRAGEQISIEMSSPGGGAPIRLKGTMDQVEQQMRDQGLSPATKQKIRRALGQ